MNALRLLNFIGTTAALLCASMVPSAAEPAAPKPPDRRELWVPADKLGRVLDKNAVLLTREQYDTLLRDAGLDKNPKPEAPAAAVLSSAAYRALPDGKTAVIHGDLTVSVLRDGWCALPLDFSEAAIAEVKLDGEGVLTPRNPELRAPMPDAEKPRAGKQAAVPERPAQLLVRGRGEHRLTVKLTVPIRVGGGVSSISLGLPGAAAGSFTLSLPGGATLEKSDAPVRVSRTAGATTATVALSPACTAIALSWKAGAGNEVKIPVRAQVLARYDIDAEKVAGSFRIHLEAPLGELPSAFEFAVPPGVKVLAVRADELRGWEAVDGRITASFQEGARAELDLEIGLELQPMIGKAAVATPLPLPVLKGAARFDGVLRVAGADNVTIKDVSADVRMRRVPTAGDRGERGFFCSYEFSGGSVAPKVVIERAEPGLETDLDTLVEFRSDAVFVTRTLTLRERKGRRFSTAITLPAGEEFLDVRRIEEVQPVPNQTQAQGALQPAESEPEWTREGGKLLIKWSDEAAKPRVFRVRTRIEPEKWAQLPPEGIALALGDAKIADSAKVAGYIALAADPAFRIEAQPGEALERRDGRSTPVRGEYAWFRRDAFDLTVKIARRPSEVLAALTGYALPLEGVLDLHAVMNYQFLGGGTRSVKLRVPKDIAQNFHFDGPQIAERALEGDVWTISFQKELTGAYALGITAQVPVAKRAANGNGSGNGGSGKGYSFSARVPVIAPLEVVRASGLWAVEANTETEITFEARGMNELDSLLAPQLADYTPRHRVIGVFGWLGADYSLTLNGVRHAPAGMLAAIVDLLELNTVVSTGGTHRHEAVYRLRSTGVEYLDVVLPQGAQLLSVAIDGAPIKPVADRPGSVRLPLPAKRDANTGVAASLVYETDGSAWKSRGKLALAAPAISAGIPVLKSAWRVWVPDGFSLSDIESNLPVPEAQQEELLVKTLARLPLVLGSRVIVKSTADAPDFAAPRGGMPSQQRYRQDMLTLSAGAPLKPAPATPLAQEIRDESRPGVATRNLGELEGRDSGVRDRLSTAKKYADLGRFDLAEKKFNEVLAVNPNDADARKGKEELAKLKDESGRAAYDAKREAKPREAGGEIWSFREGGKGMKTAGLLPVSLDLPKDGRVLVFEGLFAPENLVMRYDDWWSRARALWLWFVSGGVAFYLLAPRRPWWRTLWAVLVLSALPLCAVASWTPVCNALLGGWLAGLALNRIGAWCVFRARSGKAVLA